MKEKDKNTGSQRIRCGVTDCVHNCPSDCTCRLESIKVNVVEDKSQACSCDGTACKSYDFGGNLNESEILGGN